MAKRWAAPLQPASNRIELQRALNRMDAGGGTVLVGEKDSRFWKGEPFEQAMAYHMIAVNDALEGDPGLVNSGAEGEGWLWSMTVGDESQLDSLMSLDDYKKTIG